MGVKCYEVARVLIYDYVTEHDDLKINGELISEFKETCSNIDKFAKDFEATGYDVEIDKDTGEIKISVFCGEIIIEDKSHLFYNVLDKAKRVSFKNGDEDDSVIVNLVFDGVFSKM